MTRPKLLKCASSGRSCVWTVSENELSSETIVSAVMDLSFGYRNLAMNMPNRARNEISTRSLMASEDVHLAGLQSIPCFRSWNAVSIAFLDLYIDRVCSAVNGRFVRSTKILSRPHVIVLTAWSTAASLLANASGKR